MNKSMAREQSPDQIRAFKLWCESDRTLKPTAIAAELGVNASLVRKWKSYYKWEEQDDPKPKRRGAPSGNKNAKNNKGGPGGPIGNSKAVTHGLFRKFLPDDEETKEIYDMTADISPLDMLWEGIRIQFTKIVSSLKVQHVTGKDEMIKELKKQKFEVHSKGRGKDKELIPVVIEEEYEFQFAWDRSATAMTSQSTAWSTLVKMIKQYEDMLRAMPVEEVQEEHKTRVQKLKLEVEKLTNKDDKDDDSKLIDDWVSGVMGDE